MNLFFDAHLAEGQATSLLPPEEAFHCIKVMRMRQGDNISLTNGKGVFFHGKLLNQDLRKLKISIERWETILPPAKQIAIAVAPTKNTDRLEWFVEKATEIGITQVFPLLMEHSERKKLKLDRLEKVAISALKQSQRAYLPTIHPLMPLEELMELPLTDFQRFVAIVAENEHYLLKQATPKTNCIVLIGPEGGFSEEEIKKTSTAGFKPVSLGENRLRTETAALVACQLLQTVEWL